MNTAQLLALFLEALFFGTFSVLYFIAVFILLLRSDSITSTNRRLFYTATLMFILSIVHMAIDVRRAVEAFINFGDQESGGSNVFYSNIGERLGIAKDVVYITQTLVGDGFVTYRLYMVWDRNLYIVILPIMMLLATGVTGYGACYEEAVATGIFGNNIRPWITAFFSTSLATNVIATILIAYRIWHSGRKVRRYRASGLTNSHWPVIETVVQSAAIYSAALVALLGCYIANSFAQYTVLDAMTPLIGVVFTLIIIRVGLGYTGHSTGDKGLPEARVPAQSQNDYQLRPVAINVQVSRHHDRNSFDQYETGVKTKNDLDDESGGSVGQP